MKKKIDILIKDGLIFEGGMSEPYVSDIAITGDKIAAIGHLNYKDAENVIDARGLAVCPGFIDSHAHSDFTLIADPAAEGKICQGVTTEINGNCGMSAAPLYNKAFERREPNLMDLGIKERWNTLTEYFRILKDINPALNVAFLAGHGNLRGSVIGYEDREPTADEMKKIAKLLEYTLDEGAIGLSTGLIYPPGIYTQTDEIISLARLLKKKDLIYTSHMRSEGDRLIEAINEVIDIGEKASIKVHISHIKTAGRQNWNKADKAIEIIMDAIEKGVDITCDRYPYTASSTDLDSILPAWTYEGGNTEEINRLKNMDVRKKIRVEILKQLKSDDYWNRILVSSVISDKNRWVEGKSIAEISRILQKDEIETVFDMLVDEDLRVGAIFHSMCEENLRKFIKLPFCMIGSDSSARGFSGPTGNGRPHPRTFGTFPRVISRFVNNERLLGMPEAIYKMTMLPAERFGLKKRGCIRQGMYADILIFDPVKIADRATYDMPFQKPEGILYVFVNGRPAIHEGKIKGERNGRILKAGKVLS